MDRFSVDSLVVEVDIEGLGNFSGAVLLLGQIRNIGLGKVDIDVGVRFATSGLGSSLNGILNLVVWNINVQGVISSSGSRLEPKDVKVLGSQVRDWGHGDAIEATIGFTALNTLARGNSDGQAKECDNLEENNQKLLT
jgi:hypothetical protein